MSSVMRVVYTARSYCTLETTRPPTSMMCLVPASSVVERMGSSRGLMAVTVSCPKVPAGSVSLPAGASTPPPRLT